MIANNILHFGKALCHSAKIHNKSVHRSFTKDINYKSFYSFFWSTKETKPTKETEYSNTRLDKDVEDDFGNSVNLKFIIADLKAKNKEKEPLLPPKDPKLENKLTVLIEMDEVLVHVFSPDEHEGYLLSPLRDHDYLIHFKKYDTYLSVYQRENLDTFLRYIKDNTEPILYCTGEKEYVDLIMDKIDPEQSIFPHRIYQDGCSKAEYEQEQVYDFVKDLDWVGRDLKRTVLVDAKPFCFWPNPSNGIPILEFYADSNEKDDELLNLIDILEELKKEDDVRTYLKNTYSIETALEESNML